jgi:hypothetical protein
LIQQVYQVNFSNLKFRNLDKNTHFQEIISQEP